MNRLTDKHFSFKCPMNWNEMKPSENGRFCSHCRKEVFDLTNCSLNEVRALQEKHGSICGSIRIAQVAAVAISLSAAACKEKRPDVVGEIEPPPSTSASRGNPSVKPDAIPVREVSPHTNDEPVVMGRICPPPPKKDGEPEKDGNSDKAPENR